VPDVVWAAVARGRGFDVKLLEQPAPAPPAAEPAQPSAPPAPAAGARAPPNDSAEEVLRAFLRAAKLSPVDTPPLAACVDAAQRLLAELEAADEAAAGLPAVREARLAAHAATDEGEAAEEAEEAQAPRRAVSIDSAALPALLPALEAALLALRRFAARSPSRAIRHPAARRAWAAQHGAAERVPWPLYLLGLCAALREEAVAGGEASEAGEGDGPSATTFLLQRLGSATGGARLAWHMDREGSGNCSVSEVDAAFPPDSPFPHLLAPRLQQLLDCPPERAPAVAALRCTLPPPPLLCAAAAREGGAEPADGTLADALCRPDGPRALLLHGPPGAGKSWMAIREGHSALARGGLPGGAYWADARGRGARAQLAAAIGLALGARLPPQAGAEAVEACLARALGAAQRRAGPQLLVLDGCDAMLASDPGRSCLRLLTKLAACAPGLRLLLTSRAPLAPADRASLEPLGLLELRVGPLSLRAATEFLEAAFPADAAPQLRPADGGLSRQHAKDLARLCGRSPAALAPLAAALRAAAPQRRGEAVAGALHALRLARGARVESDPGLEVNGCQACAITNSWDAVYALFAPGRYYATEADEAEASAAAAEAAGGGADRPVGAGLRAFELDSVQRAAAALALADLPASVQRAAAALTVFPAGFDAEAAAAVMCAAERAAAPPGAAEEAEAAAAATAAATLELLASRSLLWRDARAGRLSVCPGLRAAAPELPLDSQALLSAAAAGLARHFGDALALCEVDVAAGCAETAMRLLARDWHNASLAAGAWAEAGAADAPAREQVLRARAALARLAALVPPGRAAEREQPGPALPSPAAAAADAPAVQPSAAPVSDAEMDQLRAYAAACAAEGQHAEAETAYGDLLSAQAASAGGFDVSLADTRCALASVLSASGRAREAAAQLAAALEAQETAWGAGDARTAPTQLRLSQALREAGRDGAPAARAALRLLSDAHGWESLEAAAAHAALCGAYAADGEHAAALEEARLCLRLRAAALGPLALETGNAQATLGVLLERLGRASEAREAYAAAAAAFRASLGGGHSETAWAEKKAAHEAEVVRVQAGGDLPWRGEHQSHAWSRWDSTLGPI